MMPGLGFAEMILLALVAIVVVGPKELPLMMRKFGRFTGRMRAMAFEFRQGFEELGRQAEIDELRKEVESLKQHTGLDDLKREVERDAARLESDVAQSLRPPPLPQPATHPAAGAAGQPTPTIAPPAAARPGAVDAGNPFIEDEEPAAPAPARQDATA
jgi:sec-independent protein translocase protein TatB